MNRSPSFSRSIWKRSAGTTLSPVKRRPSTQTPSSAARAWMRVQSAGETWMSDRRAFPTGRGREGWLRTGATTESSTVMARPNPPV